MLEYCNSLLKQALNKKNAKKPKKLNCGQNIKNFLVLIDSSGHVSEDSARGSLISWG